MPVQKWNWNTANPSTIHDERVEQNSSDIYWESDGHLIEYGHSSSYPVKAIIWTHASQEQVQQAYGALTNHWDTKNFNQRVWNDLVDKIAALQIEWEYPTDERLSVPYKRSCKRDDCAYMSDETEKYVTNKLTRNRRQELWAYKFNLLVEAFTRVKPADWTWSWEEDGVLIVPGTPVKGQYILDLVRAINTWCDFVKAPLDGIVINFDQTYTANLRLGDPLEARASESFNDLSISVNPEIIESMGIIFQGIIADLVANGTVTEVDAEALYVPPIVFRLDQDIDANVYTGQPIQYTGSLSDTGLQIDVLVGFSTDLLLAVSMTFPFSVSPVGVVTFNSQAMTVDLNFVNEAGAIVNADEGMTLNINLSDLVFTFDATCDIMELKPSYHLPDASGEMGFRSYGSILFGLFQDVVAEPSYITPLADGTVLTFKKIAATCSASFGTLSDGTVIFCTIARFTADSAIETRSNAINHVFHASKIASQDNTIITSDSAHAQKYRGSRISAIPNTIRASSAAEVESAKFAAAVAVAIIQISKSASVIARLHNAVTGSGTVALDETSTLDQHSHIGIRGNGEVESPVANAPLAQHHIELFVGTGDVRITGTATEHTYRLARAQANSYIGFAVVAMLTSITYDETLAITLDPYLATMLDDYDVTTLETNFTV